MLPTLSSALRIRLILKRQFGFFNNIKMAEPSVTLENGAKMPLMAFGTLMETLNPDNEKTTQIIENALDVGYRHLDTARIYGTEKMVGQAVRNKIASGLIKREDVFITSKLWRTDMSRKNVVAGLKKSLKDLELPYVDLYLIHWPTAFQQGEELLPRDSKGELICATIDYLDTWKGMEECFKLGLTKAIGLSNFNSKQIQRILDNSTVKPANNQIESHPYLTNSKLVEFCQGKGISVMAYAPLAGFNADYRKEMKWPTIYTDSTIKEIADKHGKTPAQVALRYQIQRNVGVAPKSSKIERMKQNFEALTFSLSKEEMETLNGCNRNYRLNNELPDHPYFPFNEEF